MRHEFCGLRHRLRRAQQLAVHGPRGELHALLLPFNMDDITYGPLKCSQDYFVSDDYMSYWYECSGNGTSGGGASGSGGGVDDDDGSYWYGASSSLGLDDDAAVDPMTAAMSPSDPSTYALVLGFVLGLVVAAATWYKVLSRCCKGQIRRHGRRRKARAAGPGRVGRRARHPPRAGLRAPGRQSRWPGKLMGYVAGPRRRRRPRAPSSEENCEEELGDVKRRARGPQIRAQAVRVHAGAQGGVLRAPPRQGGQAGEDR